MAEEKQPEATVPEGTTDAIKPKCAQCGLDPLRVMRLRYDFPDGVVAEILFCSGCRATISALIVGIERKQQHKV